MKSLFLRMRLVHWLGVVLLVANATFFTDNLFGSIVQYFVALVVLLHDIDEKRWGVDTLRQVSAYLAHFTAKDLSREARINATFNQEVHDMLTVIDQFRENIRVALNEVKQSSLESGKVADSFSQVSRRIGRHVGETLGGINQSVAETTRDMSAQSEVYRGLSDASRNVERVIEGTSQWVGGVTEMVKRTAEVSAQVQGGVERIVGQIASIQTTAQANASAATEIIESADRMAGLSRELDGRLARFQT